MRVHEIIKGVDRWWWHPKVNEAYLFMEIEKGNREVEQEARESGVLKIKWRDMLPDQLCSGLLVDWDEDWYRQLELATDLWDFDKKKMYMW